MKIYGFSQKSDSELKLLSEVNLVAEPAALRDLASFLYLCDDEMEDQNEDWEQDRFDSNEVACPEFIVFNPDIVDE